jgi:hypothetical protein
MAVVTNAAYRVPSRRSSPLAGTPCSTRRVASYRHSIATTRPRSGELGSTSRTTAASVSAAVVAGIDVSSSTSVTKSSTSGRTPKPSSDDSCAATMSAWRSTSVSSPRSAARRFPSRSASVGNGVVPYAGASSAVVITTVVPASEHAANSAAAATKCTRRTARIPPTRVGLPVSRFDMPVMPSPSAESRARRRAARAAAPRRRARPTRPSARSGSRSHRRAPMRARSDPRRRGACARSIV